MKPTRFLASLTALLILASSANLSHGQVTEHVQANQWLNQSPLPVRRYAFDQNWWGFTNHGGDLTPRGIPVQWTLTGGPINVSMFIHNIGSTTPRWMSSANLRRIFRVRPGAAIVDGTSQGRTSGARLDVGNSSFWAFSPPIRGLFTYYSSQARAATVTMNIYSNGNRIASLRRGSTNNSLAQGHGFHSTVDVNAVEFFYSGPDRQGGGYAIIGEFAGLAPGQSSLGNTTIQNYQGHHGNVVPFDFAIAR